MKASIAFALMISWLRPFHLFFILLVNKFLLISILDRLLLSFMVCCLVLTIATPYSFTPKDLLYGELATGKRPTGLPQLCFKDVCKRDLQALGINTDSWEVFATDKGAWRHRVKLGHIAICKSTASKSGGEKAS